MRARPRSASSAADAQRSPATENPRLARGFFLERLPRRFGGRPPKRVKRPDSRLAHHEHLEPNRYAAPSGEDRRAAARIEVVRAARLGALPAADSAYLR